METSRWWIILLLFTIIIIWILHKQDPIVYEQPVLKLQPPVKDTYSTLDGLSIQESLAILEKAGKEVQEKLPQFPSLPPLWLLPPTEKGDYASLGERHSIECLQLIFPGHTFVKDRYDWLRNPKTGRKLELDGYCEELSLAIEYNGIQHYVHPNFTNMTKKEFVDQRYRDKVKEDICIKRKICLIRIPYTVPLERIPLAVYSKLLDSVPEEK